MSEMKDSGIPWIGDIDARVQMTPVKYLLEAGKNAVKVGPFGSQLSGTDFQNEETEYWVYNQRSVIDRNICKGSAFISEEKYNSMKGFHVKSGDILITTRGTIGKIFRLPSNANKGILHPCIIRFRLNDDVYDYELLEMIFNESDMISRQLLYESNSTTIEVIYSDTLRNIKVPVWSIEMQKWISTFLKEKCAEIDALSADIQSEIDTLEAYKRSVITEAVTKGLDKNVPMKDSGIEWVGEIPESWEIVNIKRIYDRSHRYPLGDGDHGMIKPTDYIEEGVPYIRVQNLGFCTDLKIDNIVYISAEKNNRIKSSTLRPNDVLFAKTGATIGKTGIVPETMPIANTTSHVGKITVSKEYNPRYIYYVLSSYIGYKQFWDIASLKSTRPELSIEETKRLLFTVPMSKDIQDKIVDYLDNVCKDIDLIIVQKQEQLTVLAEYKKSIIYEYVTGKKEVLVT